MTDLIYFSAPLLLAIPFIAVVFSVFARIFCGITVLSWISAAIHAFCIAAVVYYGGGLTDIIALLILSLIASGITGIVYDRTKKGEDR